MKCRPGKWLVRSPIALLPLLAAFVIGTRGLTEDVSERTFKSVTAAGGDWATVTWDGRDASITGDAPSQEAIDKVLAAASETYGVRRVASSARVVAPPPKVELPLPTIESILTASPQPEIRGTWPEGVAKTLAVTVGGTAYTLGQNPELTTNAGAWLLKSPAPLADGEYDVGVAVSDGATVTAAASPGKITIDTKAPETPSVLPVAAGSVWPFALTGKWAEGDATELTAKLAGQTFAVGKDADFTSDGKGNWTLAPKIDLAPGSYDLELESKDKAGNVSAAKLVAAVVIPEPVEPPKTPEPVEPPKLAGPTIDPLITNLSTPKITGTWPEGQAKSLSVIVNGAATALGAPELVSDGSGRWTFTPAVPLADGSYDVSAEITDAAGNKIAAAGAAKVVVDTAPPAAPAVSSPASGTTWPYAFTGTWPEGDATSLEAQFAGRNWVAGQDPSFTSDGKGNWRFDPALDLAPGSYDLLVTARDGAGNPSQVSLPAAVVIAAAEPPKAEEPPPPPAEPPKAEEPPPPPAEPPKAEEPPPPPPVVKNPPTISSTMATVTRPVISGTVAPGDALEVTVAGKRYVQGTDQNLKVDAQGNWTLAIPTPLGDGAYEVQAKATDSSGKLLADSTSNELTVDAAGPASPTVTLQAAEGEISQVSGTWAEGDATKLHVTIPGVSADATLGQSNALTSDGKGNWSLVLPQPLAPGSYDVSVETSDAQGRVARDQTRFELLVKQVEPPYDCEGAFEEIAEKNQIRFEFNRTRINPPYDEALARYLEFVRDPRCAAYSVTVEGHADYKGPETYNQWLSELRAMQVVDAMVTQGADPSRLATVGMSEKMPVDSGRGKKHRKMNRRVEFKLSR